MLYPSSRCDIGSLSKEKKTQIILIKFESLILNIDVICPRLGRFLKARETKSTHQIITKKIPRNFDKSMTQNEYGNINQKALKPSLSILDRLISGYDVFYKL